MKATLLVVLAALAGCSAVGEAGPAGPLTATLVSPIDIALAWPDFEPGVAGVVVEFATEPDGRYTILEFLPPGRTTFTHPDLMPRTPFYYRVRPVDGPAPTELTPIAGPADVVTFTWTDTAGDEDGYLLEAKPKARPEFRVAAVIDPNVTSYELTTLPEEKDASFRVRAFRYGAPSNIAHQTTGDDDA